MTSELLIQRDCLLIIRGNFRQLFYPSPTPHKQINAIEKVRFTIQVAFRHIHTSCPCNPTGSIVNKPLPKQKQGKGRATIFLR